MMHAENGYNIDVMVYPLDVRKRRTARMNATLRYAERIALAAAVDALRGPTEAVQGNCAECALDMDGCLTTEIRCRGFRPYREKGAGR